jgi:hypothetical protein
MAGQPSEAGERRPGYERLNKKDAPSFDPASGSIIHSEDFPATNSGLRMAGQLNFRISDFMFWL